MKIKLLLKFVRKYGRPESVTIYLDSKRKHKCYNFKNGRWVATDITGEMSWDGKKNCYNVIPLEGYNLIN